jgi:hypothetical protein
MVAILHPHQQYRRAQIQIQIQQPLQRLVIHHCHHCNIIHQRHHQSHHRPVPLQHHLFGMWMDMLSKYRNSSRRVTPYTQPKMEDFIIASKLFIFISSYYVICMITTSCVEIKMKKFSNQAQHHATMIFHVK